MESKNKFFEDITKIMGSAADATFSSVADMKSGFESMADAKMNEILQKHNVVTREEFDVLQDLLQKTIQQNEKLQERLEALESSNKSTKKTSSEVKPTKSKKDAKDDKKNLSDAKK